MYNWKIILIEKNWLFYYKNNNYDKQKRFKNKSTKKEWSENKHGNTKQIKESSKVTRHKEKWFWEKNSIYNSMRIRDRRNNQIKIILSMVII